MSKVKPTLNKADIDLLKGVFITRDDKDIGSIKNLITLAVDGAIEGNGLVTKTDISHLPTKDEFYEQTGKILKRLEDLEEEKDILSGRVSNHGDRIEKIENNLGISSAF
jgi:hypothetical protein